MQIQIRKLIPCLAVAAVACLTGLAVSACNSTSSTDDAQITLTAPKDGSSFKVGDKVVVTWSTHSDPNAPINAVDVMVSPDSGNLWSYLRPAGSIAPDNTAEWEHFTWTVPETLSVSGLKFGIVGNKRCLLKVEQYTPTPLQRSKLIRFTVSAQ